MLDRLDAAAIRRWCAVGLDALRRHQTEIDELNVFPVPDGDTGTNLVLTLSSAWAALLAEPESEPAPSSEAVDGGDPMATEAEIARLGRVLQCMARGALLGARGNSGVILSQLLRGTAEALSAVPVARGRALATALAAAVKAGYTAVSEPVEGTVLSVAAGAADAATATDSDDLATVVEAAARGAAVALARTPEQLPALARAGVVDAGGRGLVLLLEALVEVVTGRAPATAPLARVARDPGLLMVAREGGSLEYGYEVQYLLDADEDAVMLLRARLAELGDSVVIVGSGEPASRLTDPVGEPASRLTDSVGEPASRAVGVAGAGERHPVWNVHVHVNDVGAAIEAGVVVGRPHRISVTRFADQVAAATVTAAPAVPVAAAPVDPHARGLVVVAAGTGLAQVFAAEGALVVDGGPMSCPSTMDILAAIRSTGAGQVVLFPNDTNVLAVAQLAAEQARQAGIQVGVVPTKSPVQAIAAIAMRDQERHSHDDMIAMAEAAGACRYAEVTVAVREALTVAGLCHPGDILGLVEGEVNVIGQDLTETARALLDRMLGGGGELVTLVLGANAPAALGDLLHAHLAHHWPFAEVRLLRGDQPHFPLLVGVE